MSLGQVVAVLERAEIQAREQGRHFSPKVAQAAAELGMLWTTYTMQQLAFDEKNDGLRTQDAPVARASDMDGGVNDGVKTPASPEDVQPAVQLSNVDTPVVEPDSVDLHAGYVTYDQVVIAAVRLANMMDSWVPHALVEIQRTDHGQGLSLWERLATVEVQGAPERQRFPLRDSLLGVVTTLGGSTLGYANGRIPAAVLCPLMFAPGHMLRCDAAQRLAALSEAFEREFGYPIPITDSYRSYVQQIAVARAKPHLAAVPGTSNHGWGLAVDLSVPIAGGASREYVWLRVHGPAYGWDNPSWARLGGAKPEPWHFEFFAVGSVPNRAIDASGVGTWGSALPSTSPDDASPRRELAADTRPKDRPTAGEVRKPPRKSADKPSADPPAQKPAKPTPKPPPKPEPKPTAPPASPDPSPSPSPSLPSQEPSASPSTTPSPAPSPTPTPSRGDTPHVPAPSPSPSLSVGPLSNLARGLGPAVDDAED